MILLPLFIFTQSLIPSSAATVIPEQNASAYHVESTAIPALIAFYSSMYGVSNSEMDSLVSCESSYNPTAVGDNGNSHGLAQINQPAHPTISVSEAESPLFALDYMAKHLALGQDEMWHVCYHRFLKKQLAGNPQHASNGA